MKRQRNREVYTDATGTYQLSRTGRKIYPRPCQQCQDSYFPARRDQKHCSGSCRVMASRRRRQEAEQKGNLSAKAVQPAQPKGKLGSLTGSELGDLTLGVVAGNVVTGAGKQLLGLKSPELKALERIEKKLTQGAAPAPLPQRRVQFTGRSFPIQRPDQLVFSVTELLVNGQLYYLDNAGVLYRGQNNRLEVVQAQGRQWLGLPEVNQGR